MTFFSADYCSLIARAPDELSKVQHRYEEFCGENFWKNAWYYTKRGFVLVTSGAAGVAAGAIAGALTGGAGAPYGALAAKAVWQELEVTQPKLNDTASLKNAIDKLQQRIDDSLYQLEQECSERRRTLQKLSTDKLLALDSGNGEHPA